MINHDDIPLLLTVTETQKLLRLGRGKTYALIRSNEIPSIRLGGAIRIPRGALLRMLEQQEFANARARMYILCPRLRRRKSFEGPRWF